MSEGWLLEPGPGTGFADRVVALHADYYGPAAGFGPDFAAVVRRGIDEFLPRLTNPANQVWRAMRGDTLHGSVAIDGEDLGPGVAHLRWFIASDALRGRGAGKALLAAALAHADAQGFAETRLWTFAGLDAARALYERNGFRLVEERNGDQWGKVVREQMFSRPRGGETGRM